MLGLFIVYDTTFSEKLSSCYFYNRNGFVKEFVFLVFNIYWLIKFIYLRFTIDEDDHFTIDVVRNFGKGRNFILLSGLLWITLSLIHRLHYFFPIKINKFTL